MSENQANGGESFAELFEEYSQGLGESVKVGDKVTGRIISVSGDSVFIDTGTKIDGVAEKPELLDDKGEFPYAEGDEIELYVVQADASTIKLSRALSGAGGAEILREAYESRLPVEGRVQSTCKGGFNIEVMKRRVFCPVSQIDTRFVEDPETYVGQEFQFLIEKFEQNGRNVVVSRRRLLEREQSAAREEFLASVKPGAVLEGTVVRLQPFGAFVELVPGVEGLVHISELGYARVATPEEVTAVGDKVQVKVLEIAAGKKPGQLKISLSVKQTQADPWETVSERVKIGEKVTGKVVRCADFGAFVEILPGIEGLVHVSEMSYEKRVTKGDEIVKPGDMVSVVVKDVDPAKRRIGLSLKDAAGDPWMEVPTKYASGQAVQGTVEKRETFGLFITLEPGITALLPGANIRKAIDPKPFDALKPGDAVSLVVENVDAGARRISLAPADVKDEDEWRSMAKPRKNAGAPRSSAPKTVVAGDSGGFGSLGAALQQALKDKN